jgi:oxaloacetate decarboxylase (Na+ extruding) subunit alpha
MSLPKIEFIDTTLRDGQQSLWALNMSTDMMTPIMPDLDRSGFAAAEFFVPNVQLRKMMLDLNEDPWQWLVQGMRHARKTELRLHGGYRGGLSKIPESISLLMIQKMIDYGLTTTRTSNAWNDYGLVKEEVVRLKKMGMRSVVNIIFSVSPRHTDDYFVARTQEAAATEPYRLCFKDVGGLLTPDRTRNLIPKVLAAANGIPVEFHCHCNNGLGPLNVIEAVKAGVRIVHTAIPPLANGSSQPSVFNVEKNLRILGYGHDLDLAPIQNISQHFETIAADYGFVRGAPFEYDETLYLHQVPGGMISNLKHQLNKVGLVDKLPQTLEEAAQVRKDMGYPIMVTPLSQFVGTQAAINVIVGERYKQVSDEIIQYALGLWGQDALQYMDPTVRDKILSRRRAREVAAKYQQEDTSSVAEIRKKLGPSLSDEELILKVYTGMDRSSLKTSGAPTARPSDIASILQAMGRYPNIRSVYIKTQKQQLLFE